MIGIVFLGLVNFEIGVVEYMLNILIDVLVFGDIIWDNFYV